MKGLRLFKLFLVITFTVLLLASPIENAFAGTWIIYDDNTKESNLGTGVGCYLGVKFTLLSGDSANLLAARFWLQVSDDQPWHVEVHVFDADGFTDLTAPITYNLPTGPFDQFFDLDLSSLGITVGKEFWIALKFTMIDPNLGLDTGSSYSRSYVTSSFPDWLPYQDNFMIRAEIDPIVQPTPEPAPVGGLVIPVNKLTILTPCIALAGLIAVVTTAYIFKRRKD